MSSYQQMSEAAEKTTNNYREYRERVWGYFAAIINGLIDHCGVPDEHIVYMKWNELEGQGCRFAIPDNGENIHYRGQSLTIGATIASTWDYLSS